MKRNHYTQFNGVFVRKLTMMAALLEIGDNEHWVPISNIDIDESDKLEEGNIGTFLIATWFVDKECIED